MASVKTIEDIKEAAGRIKELGAKMLLLKAANYG